MIPASRRLGKKDGKFKDSLSYIAKHLSGNNQTKLSPPPVINAACLQWITHTPVPRKTIFQNKCIAVIQEVEGMSWAFHQHSYQRQIWNTDPCINEFCLWDISQGRSKKTWKEISLHGLSRLFLIAIPSAMQHSAIHTAITLNSVQNTARNHPLWRPRKTGLFFFFFAYKL